MKTYNWMYTSLIYSLLFAFFACTSDVNIPDKEVNQDPNSVVKLKIGARNSQELTAGPIRVFAFDQMNSYIKESNSILVEEVGSTQKIELPITQNDGTNKLILLANAGEKGDQSTIATPLIPMIAKYNNIMVSVKEVEGRIANPSQFFYGKDEFKLLPDVGISERDIELKNLCARTDISFSNVFPKTIDSVVVYIENAGKDIGFDGLTKSTGVTVNQVFTQSQVESGAVNGFLLFPSNITPTLYADFYFKNGHIKKFSRILTGYNFVSNKVLNFKFDLANIEDELDLYIKIENWDGTTDETVQGVLNFNLNMNGGDVSNYLAADIVLQCNYTPTDVYPVRYEGVQVAPVIGNPNQLKLVVPVTNIELRNYTIKSVRLKDRDGWYEALDKEVSFDIQFNMNQVNVDVLGRTSYEDRLMKKWFTELDNVNGTFYPGELIMSELTNGASVFTKVTQLGLFTNTIQNEKRITGIKIPDIYNGLEYFIVPSFVSNFKYFTYLKFSEVYIESLTLSNLPYLTTVDFGPGFALFISFEGCTKLSSFSMSDFANTQVMSLNLSSTSITSISPLFFMPSSFLRELYWANAGLTDANVNAFISNLHYNTYRLDLSDNLLTVYPNVAGFSNLEHYNVSGNNIVSCALSYMKKFGVDSILPQRTGLNWWCP